MRLCQPQLQWPALYLTSTAFPACRPFGAAFSSLAVNDIRQDLVTAAAIQASVWQGLRLDGCADPCGVAGSCRGHRGSGRLACAHGQQAPCLLFSLRVYRVQEPAVQGLWSSRTRNKTASSADHSPCPPTPVVAAKFSAQGLALCPQQHSKVPALKAGRRLGNRPVLRAGALLNRLGHRLPRIVWQLQVGTRARVAPGIRMRPDVQDVGVLQRKLVPGPAALRVGRAPLDHVIPGLHMRRHTA